MKVTTYTFIAVNVTTSTFIAVNVTTSSQLTSTLLAMAVLLLHYNGSSYLHIRTALDAASAQCAYLSITYTRTPKSFPITHRTHLSGQGVQLQEGGIQAALGAGTRVALGVGTRVALGVGTRAVQGVGTRAGLGAGTLAALGAGTLAALGAGYPGEELVQWEEPGQPS